MQYSTTTEHKPVVEIGSVRHLQYLFSMPYRRRAAADMSRKLRQRTFPDGAVTLIRWDCEPDGECCRIERREISGAILLEAIEDRTGLQGFRW